MSTHTYKSIDLSKFVAALAVVCLHARPFIGTLFDYVLNTFFVMAVPFFFCVSSYFFHKKKSSLSKYTKRLLQLYFTWFLLELPYILHEYSFDSWEGVKDFLWHLFLQNTYPVSWFLTALIEAMIVVVILNRKGHTKILYFISVLCFILSLFASMYNGLLASLPYGDAVNRFLSNIAAAQSFILAIPYCVMGMLLTKTELHLSAKKEIIIFIILLICVFIEAMLCRPICSRQNASLFILPTVFFIVYLLLHHELDVNEQLSIYMRKTSIIMYIMQRLVMLFLNYYIGIELGWLMTILTILITVPAAGFIVYASKRVKVLRLLY